MDKQASGGTVEASKKIHEKPSEPKDEAAAESEDMREHIQEESDKETEEEDGDEEDLQEADSEEEQEDEEEEEEGLEESDHMPSIEDRSETNIKEAGAEQPAPGLRRRNRPDWTHRRSPAPYKHVLNYSLYLLSGRFSFRNTMRIHSRIHHPKTLNKQ